MFVRVKWKIDSWDFQLGNDLESVPDYATTSSADRDLEAVFTIPAVAKIGVQALSKEHGAYRTHFARLRAERRRSEIVPTCHPASQTLSG